MMKRVVVLIAAMILASLLLGGCGTESDVARPALSDSPASLESPAPSENSALLEKPAPQSSPPTGTAPEPTTRDSGAAGTAPALPPAGSKPAGAQAEPHPGPYTESRLEPQEPGLEPLKPQEPRLGPHPRPHLEPGTAPETAARPKPRPGPEITVHPDEVKALYSTGWVAGIPARVNRLIELIDETELNAIVIDVKDDMGLLTYKSGVSFANKIGASREKVKDIHALLDTCYEKDIYPIARIVVFKDPVLASKRPDLAIRDGAGKLWRDRKGIAWVDPTKQEVWEYNVEVAEEAARLGFKEIQFDYVRFPDEKSYKAISGYSEPARVDTIRRFLQYAKRQLAPYEVAVSADVFGLTCSAQDDMGIGQKIEDVADVVDYISPMVYPSHFAYGSYGIKDPDAHPYETVKKSLSDGLGRIAGKEATMRPWLQDFSLKHQYGPEDVRIQIKAAHELGIGTWMLWNPSSEFTALAVKQGLPALMPSSVAGPSTPNRVTENDTACGAVVVESPALEAQDATGQLIDTRGLQAEPAMQPGPAVQAQPADKHTEPNDQLAAPSP